ncbi:unnamed protein product, partial [Meganyctiphanes norvegica]
YQFTLQLQAMKSQVIVLLFVVTCVTIDAKLLHGKTNDKQDYTSNDVYNQSKENVTVDRLNQPENYEYGQQCPDVEDIAPCICTYDSMSNATDLDCSDVESEDQLKQIFKADFPVKNFRRFILKSNDNLNVLESYVFNGISFEELTCNYNQLEIIETHALDSCYETATQLDFRGNNITAYPFEELKHFSKLNVFSISKNLLNMIPADAFHGLTTLEKLYINTNTPNIVGEFEDLPNLEYIDLEQNGITSIPSKLVNTGSSILRGIFLSTNKIVSVEPGAFDIVEGLKIQMMSNLLSTLEEATWRPYLEAGGTLYANGNPLICGCDIAWLFAEDHLLKQVSDGTACAGGEFVHDLDPSKFDNC